MITLGVLENEPLFSGHFINFGGFVTNFGCFSLIWRSFYIKLVFWESARENFRLKSAQPGGILRPSRPGPKIFFPIRPGPEEFSDRVGPARSQVTEISNTVPDLDFARCGDHFCYLDRLGDHMIDDRYVGNLGPDHLCVGCRSGSFCRSIFAFGAHVTSSGDFRVFLASDFARVIS